MFELDRPGHTALATGSRFSRRPACSWMLLPKRSRPLIRRRNWTPFLPDWGCCRLGIAHVSLPRISIPNARIQRHNSDIHTQKAAFIPPTLIRCASLAARTKYNIDTGRCQAAPPFPQDCAKEYAKEGFYRITALNKRMMLNADLRA